jgi:hypothetical protein
MASPRQKRKVSRVMREHKQGKLRSGSGGKVKSRKQAIAIAMSESGQSRKRRSKTGGRRKSTGRKSARRRTGGRRKAS